MLIALSGDRCQRCDGKFPDWMYDFHHLVPEDKLFSVSSNNLLRGWKVLVKEWSKCILVCPNCHRIEHARLEGRFEDGTNS